MNRDERHGFMKRRSDRAGASEHTRGTWKAVLRTAPAGNMHDDL